MDWIESLQKAFDYVEEHITEKIDYEELAKRAYSSTFHFQRVFGNVKWRHLQEYYCRQYENIYCPSKAKRTTLNGRKINKNNWIKQRNLNDSIEIAAD